MIPVRCERCGGLLKPTREVDQAPCRCANRRGKSRDFFPETPDRAEEVPRDVVASES